MLNIKALAKVLPLFFIILIDSMGMGILIPSLTAIMVIPQHHNIASHLLPRHRELWYGTVMSIYMLAWFFSASILGDLSDQIGRKKVLMICLFGAILSYNMTAIATGIESITLLIISRIIGGITAGSQAIAQAAIIDISDQKSKTHHLGLVIMTSAVGYIAGPLLGGLLSDQHLAPWLHLSTPFYFAALLALINLILLVVFFQETLSQPKQIQIRWARSFTMLIAGFRYSGVRAIASVLSLFMFSWGIYYSFISIFLADKFHFSSGSIAVYLSLIAVGFAIGSGALAGRLAQRFRLPQMTATGLLLGASFIFISIITSAHLVWIAPVLIGTTLGTCFALLTTIASNQVDSTEQGWMMGVTSSINASSIGIAMLLSGLAASIGIHYIMYCCVGVMSLSALACLRLKERKDT